MFENLTNKLEAKFFIVDHKIRKESSKEAKLVRLFLKKFHINFLCQHLSNKRCKFS